MLKRWAVAVLITAATAGAVAAAPADPREREALSSYSRMVQGLMTKRMRGIRPHPSDEGRAVMRFTLERSGRVTSRVLVQSSGSDEIDAAVLRALPVGARLRPFPGAVTRPDLTFSVPVRFLP